MTPTLVDHYVLSFTLILVRVASFVAMLPLFGGRTVPRTIKVGMAFALSLIWFGREDLMPAAALQSAAGGVHWLTFGIAVGREVIFGAVLGFAFDLFLLPAQIAGSYIAQEMGLNLATITDPTMEGSPNIVSQLFHSLSILLFFTLNLHHVVFAALHLTFLRLPVGSSAAPFAWAAMPAAVDEAQRYGLLIAAPVGICLFVTLAVLILLNKTSPQLNLFSVGLTIRLAVGLLAMIVFVPEMLAVMHQVFRRATWILHWLAV